jgi:hypothetical protein
MRTALFNFVAGTLYGKEDASLSFFLFLWNKIEFSFVALRLLRNLLVFFSQFASLSLSLSLQVSFSSFTHTLFCIECFLKTLMLSQVEKRSLRSGRCPSTSRHTPLWCYFSLWCYLWFVAFFVVAYASRVDVLAINDTNCHPSKFRALL